MEVKGFIVAGAMALTLAQVSNPVYGQSAQSSLSPEKLPGEGLSRHSFLYCGEYEYNADQQTVHLVRNGEVVWNYQIKYKVMRNGKPDIQELGDCSLLPNGNVILTTRFGVVEVTPEKKVVWQYFGPDNSEIHSVQPLGSGRILLLQNGDPAVALTINTLTNTVEKSVIIPVFDSGNPHGQLRRARLTDADTYLVAHMDMNRVVEYDEAGNVLWSTEVASPWHAARLENGNTLVSSNKGFVREYTQTGNIVWEFTKEDAAERGYAIYNVQDVSRLKNGNTIISNWVAGALKPEQWAQTVQFIEVDSKKNVVWALREWKNPNLGPATAMQILDSADMP